MKSIGRDRWLRHLASHECIRTGWSQQEANNVGGTETGTQLAGHDPTGFTYGIAFDSDLGHDELAQPGSDKSQHKLGKKKDCGCGRKGQTDGSAHTTQHAEYDLTKV